ncbi:MAG: DUF1592 domain-containing protein [Acidobacteria bacterium]|nr:DUF1592 domain-containing protein [Acidobacteriota bacterium]
MRPFAIILSMALPALAQSPDFNKTLWPVFEKAQCRQCHNENGVASTTRLIFPREAATADEITAFGLSLRTLVNAAKPEDSPLWRKPTHRTAHGGGERIRQNTDAEVALLTWVKHLASLPEPAAPSRSTTQSQRKEKHVLRRLTHAQYNHTVRDLLGDETKPADQFPKEDFVHGFTNQADGQSISPLQAEAYARAAEKLARNAFAKGDRSQLIPCPPSDNCRAEFIRTFGRKAFRRPITETELQRYSALHARETDFTKGAQSVVEAMLQSPHFLFHLEQGAYRTASRLSYFLWDTMPDETLLTAAAKGHLDTQSGVEREVKRMLADPRAKAAFDEFLAQWLRLDRLRGALRDRNLFPEYSPELVALMVEETTRTFRSLVWDNGNFLDFYRGDTTHLVPELARLYGVEAGPEPWAKVKLPPSTERAGILGQAAFLTLTSKPADTSPTERGLFVREHFLCQQVPPPPPGVNATLPPVTDEKPVTQRERLQVHLSNAVCASCHSLVDPIGFGLEKFDAIGRHRDKELLLVHPTADEIKTKRKTKPTEYRLPINAQGELRGISGATFDSPRQLGELLAKEPSCQKCVVKQLFRYAMGRPEESGDAPVIEEAFDRFRKSQFRFQELIMAISVAQAGVPATPNRGGN